MTIDGRRQGPEPEVAADEPAGTVEPEELRLRGRPEPVTRINRRLLIGAAAVLLFFISAIVLVALKPPSLRSKSPEELITTASKPISDGLAKLPASYESLRPATHSDAGRALTSKGSSGVPLPPAPPALASEAERVERARMTRIAGQAAQSQIFFRLQFAQVGAQPRPDALPRPAAGNLQDVSELRAAMRAPAGLASETDPPASDATEGTRKLAFLRNGPEKEIYNPHALQRPPSPYQLMAGSVIAASLISGLNSDLPGFTIAAVTENVYDTVSGRHLLIPQGSRLIGKYDNVVAFGQERALVVWQRIILPDGSSILIDNLPATDTAGYAGLSDEVDVHTWKLLKGVALATVLGVGSQLAIGTGSSSDGDLLKALQQSVQSTTNRAGQRLVERNLNVQPTITVRPGWPLRVIVSKDLVLKPYQEIETAAKAK